MEKPSSVRGQGLPRAQPKDSCKLARLAHDAGMAEPLLGSVFQECPGFSLADSVAECTLFFLPTGSCTEPSGLFGT